MEAIWQRKRLAMKEDTREMWAVYDGRGRMRGFPMGRAGWDLLLRRLRVSLSWPSTSEASISFL